MPSAAPFLTWRRLPPYTAWFRDRQPQLNPRRLLHAPQRRPPRRRVSSDREPTRRRQSAQTRQLCLSPATGLARRPTPFLIKRVTALPVAESVRNSPLTANQCRSACEPSPGRTLERRRRGPYRLNPAHSTSGMPLNRPIDGLCRRFSYSEPYLTFSEVRLRFVGRHKIHESLVIIGI